MAGSSRSLTVNMQAATLSTIRDSAALSKKPRPVAIPYFQVFPVSSNGATKVKARSCLFDRYGDVSERVRVVSS